MLVTNHANDGMFTPDHSKTAGSINWGECPKGTKVVRARFLADRIDRYTLICDHSYTMVQTPDGKVYYLNNVPWNANGLCLRKMSHLKAWVYKQVKQDGRYFPGLFDALNAFL